MSADNSLASSPVRTDPRDVSPLLVGLLAAGMAIFIAVSLGILALVYPQARHGPSDAPRTAAAAPRLQPHPAQDLAHYLDAEQHLLDGYNWVDRARGTVRIPIAKAMADVAASGIPDWPRPAR